MEASVYLDQSKTKCVDYWKVKSINKAVTAKVIDTFKAEAFGDDVSECVKKIEKDITDRYKALKSRLMKQYENQFKALLAPMVTPVESKIRLDQYSKP